jgi:hypothetical protein
MGIAGEILQIAFLQTEIADGILQIAFLQMAFCRWILQMAFLLYHCTILPLQRFTKVKIIRKS